MSRTTKRRTAAVVTAAAAMLGGATLLGAPAQAGAPTIDGRSGCRVPPCGQVKNDSAVGTQVRWEDNPGDGWTTRYLGPRRVIGGYLHDRIDVDQYAVPPRCTATVEGFGGGDHPQGTSVRSGGSTTYNWYKLSSNQTVQIRSMTCRGA
jgi:hypothetical protein